MNETGTVKLAHLSDVHLPLAGGFAPRYWNLKRILGWLNWQRKRRFIHTHAALEAIVADIKAQAPDHILVSGDLINIGLPVEYSAARDWLAKLGPPDRVSVVPGNHDAYVAAEAGPGIALWDAYMCSDAFGRSMAGEQTSGSGEAFPYVRKVGGVAIVGVNSGVPTRPGSAIGEAGTAQLDRLSSILTRLGEAGLVRLVMIHHPPVPGLTDASRRLTDEAAMAEVLARSGAEIVVHGHNHVMSSVEHGGATIEGVASASAARQYADEPMARYNLMTAGPGLAHDGAFGIRIETRGLVAPGGHVRHIAVKSHDLARFGKDKKDKGLAS